MKIKVKLFGTSKELAPKGITFGDYHTIDVEENATILDVLKKLNIPVDEARVVVINSNIIRDYSYQLNSLDLFICYPPSE